MGAEPSTGGAVGFLDCYQWAVQQSENLRIAHQDVEAAKGRYQSSVGGILPDIKYNYTHLIQDTSVPPNEEKPRRKTDNSKFQLTQPLFNGLKEFSAMSGYKREIRSREMTYQRELTNLYRDVAAAFYDAARLETGVKNLNVLIDLTADRVNLLKKDARLGKSRESEVLAADAQASNLIAQRAVLQGNVKQAREILSFLTGKDLGNVPFQYSFDRVESVVPVEEALLKASHRFDLQAQKEEVDARKYAVRFAKAGYWPSIFAIGNYYTKRTVDNDIDWDILFNIDVPLFQGGKVRGDVRETYSIYVQERLRLERLEREIASEVKNALTELEASISESKMLDETYLKAKKSYESQARDYRLGLVDNLQVLSAMNTMQTVKQDLDRSILDTKLNWVNLKAAMEDIPAK